MNKLALLAAVAGLALTVPAFAQETNTTDTGAVAATGKSSYEKKTSETAKTEAGKHTKKTKVKKTTDSKGNVESDVKTKVVDDPKGLGNETTTKVEDKTKAGMTHHTKSVNGHKVEDTTAPATTEEPAGK